MQSTARMASVVSSTLPTRCHLIRAVRAQNVDEGLLWVGRSHSGKEKEVAYESCGVIPVVTPLDSIAAHTSASSFDLGKADSSSRS
jgi:hypothetical protein